MLETQNVDDIGSEISRNLRFKGQNENCINS